MSGPVLVVRAARSSDLPDLRRLRAMAGPGFTSLAAPEETLAERAARSEASFAADITAPGVDDAYLLAMEHVETKEVIGVAAVKARVGETKPFFNFRMIRVAQSSAAAKRRFDLDVLILVNEFTGCTEVGSLFLRPDRRAEGAGRMLAQSRYMLMAAGPDRFGSVVVSELRGVVTADGVSPFWEGLGRYFFRMEFAEADALSASTDNQFILDLMPKYPIYVDFLPPEARAVIGECHPDGVGARRLLEWEGFRYDRVVDVFDGGPLLSVSREAIRTVRESRRRRLRVGPVANAQPALVALAEVPRFALTRAPAALTEEFVTIAPEAARALGAEPGEEALVWRNDAG